METNRSSHILVTEHDIRWVFFNLSTFQTTSNKENMYDTGELYTSMLLKQRG